MSKVQDKNKPFEIDIKATPPTKKELEAAEAAERKRQRRNSAIRVGVVPLILITVGILFPSTSKFAWILAVFYAAVAGCVEGIHNEHEFGFTTEVSADQAACLMKQCIATPEAVEYRKGVLAQGRAFVDAELIALENWNADAEERAALAVLYDGAPPTTRTSNS